MTNKNEKPIKVVQKRIFTDCVLFYISERGKQRPTIVSEPTLIVKIRKDGVANATEVKRAGSKPFVRLTSSVPTKKMGVPVSLKGMGPVALREVGIAKNWFANGSANQQKPKPANPQPVPQRAPQRTIDWKTHLERMLNTSGLGKYVVGSYEGAQRANLRKAVIITDEKVRVVFDLVTPYGKEVLGEIAHWYADEFTPANESFAIKEVVSTAYNYFKYSDGKLNDIIMREVIDCKLEFTILDRTNIENTCGVFDVLDGEYRGYEPDYEDEYGNTHYEHDTAPWVLYVAYLGHGCKGCKHNPADPEDYPVLTVWVGEDNNRRSKYFATPFNVFITEELAQDLAEWLFKEFVDYMSKNGAEDYTSDWDAGIKRAITETAKLKKDFVSVIEGAKVEPVEN